MLLLGVFLGSKTTEEERWRGVAEHLLGRRREGVALSHLAKTRNEHLDRRRRFCGCAKDGECS